MIGWLRTNRRLTAEVQYLRGRLKAAEVRPVLVARPGPMTPPATDLSHDAGPDPAELLRGQISALEKLKTTAGTVELVREVGVWRERAGALEERLLALQGVNEAKDVDLQRITGELSAATAHLTKLGWRAERRVGLS